MKLTLAVKKHWFDLIKSGKKNTEYRLFNDYWKKRLLGRQYDFIEITLGYPRKNDGDKRIIFRFQGYEVTTINSPEWENIPQRVFAIKLR